MAVLNSKAWMLPPVLGLGHGLADCISGYLIGTVSSGDESNNAGYYILIYNLLAFAGQVPAGLITDKLKNPKELSIFSLAVIAASMWMASSLPALAIILAGIGSAFYHAAGGAASLLALPGRAISPGISAGPGVLGLGIGGLLAIYGADPKVIITLLVITVLLFLVLMNFPQYLQINRTHSETDIHDFIMILLLLGIAFRSAIWNVYSAIHLGDTHTLILISAAACLGKISGGFFSDKLGWRNYCLAALAAAVVLLAFGGGQNIYLVPGIFLLQSVTGVAIAGMHKAMPAWPGMAAGLSVGLAIALGGIPTHSGIRSALLRDPFILIISGVIACFVFYLAFSRIRRMLRSPH